MGAVGETLRRLGGNLELAQIEGPGTTFLLRLPVSMAITRAMYFRVGTHEYAASMRTIERVVNIDADKIEDLRQESEPVLEDRGEHFSVIDLRDYLGHTRGPSREGPLPVLLVRAGSQNIAVVVDEVTDNREIVVKPLGEHLASIPIYSGGSIRADGSVILVLDFIGMAYAETDVTVDQRVRDGERVEAPQVLVVDDSLTVRKAAQRDLAACGIKVSTATDGIDAQRFLEERTPDLILLDIEMPGMDGYEFLEWLRGSDIKDIPVTVISSRSTEKYRQKAFELGAEDFLAKPYRIADLMDIIHTRLGYEIEEKGTETDG
jgi:chemosensory pili system protein ChpA (sensor histidine kinase/response regulator)